MAHHQRYRRRRTPDVDDYSHLVRNWDEAAGVKMPAIYPSNPNLPKCGDLMMTRDEDANRLTRSRVVFSGGTAIVKVGGQEFSVRDAMLCVQEYDGPIEPELRRRFNGCG